MNYSEIDEIEDALSIIGRKLSGTGFNQKIHKSVKDKTPSKIEEIVTGCERVVEVLAGKYIVLSDTEKRKQKTKRWKKKYGDEYIDRTLARKYAAIPESTFDRKTEKIKKDINGTPHYKIDDLERVIQLILDSSESTLCIKTNYCFDIVRNGYIQFEEGIHYKIIENQEEFKYLDNERFDIIIKMSDIQFSENFRMQGDIEYDGEKYNITRE